MAQAALSKEEAVRRTLARHGDLPAADLARYIAQEFGITIDPKFLPIFKASIRAREQHEQFRARARVQSSQLPDHPPA